MLAPKLWPAIITADKLWKYSTRVHYSLILLSKSGSSHASLHWKQEENRAMNEFLSLSVLDYLEISQSFSGSELAPSGSTSYLIPKEPPPAWWAMCPFLVLSRGISCGPGEEEPCCAEGVGWLASFSNRPGLSPFANYFDPLHFVKKPHNTNWSPLALTLQPMWPL